MERRLDKLLRDWLTQERDGSHEAAELALWRLFQRVPQPRPPAGFAHAVLAELGLTPAVWMSVGETGRRLYRTVLAVCLVLGGLAAAFLPGTLGSLIDAGLLTGMADRGISLVADSVRMAAGGLTVLAALADVAAILAEALMTPGVVLVTAIGLILSITAFRLLQVLVTSDRSSYHASTP